MRRKTLLLAILCCMFMMSLGTAVQAQTGLVYGDRVFGEITGTQPQVFYTFGGTAGDWVTARVIGASPGMSPTLGLNAPSGQQVAFNASDSFDIVSGTARISYRVEQTGVYTLQVGALPDAQGGFLLALEGESAGTVPTLSDVPTTTTVLADTPQVFAINANPTASINLNVAGSGDYVIKLLDASGDYVAIVRSGVLAGTTLTIPAGDGQYTVVIEASEDADVTLSLGDAPASDGSGVTDPVATEEVTSGGSAPEGICTVSTTGTVNIRSGAGTNFDAFASLNAGSFLQVTGRTASNWYEINVNGTSGYVFADVVNLNGPCNNIPTVTGPTGSTGSTGSTPTPVSPTATEEVGDTTATPTTQNNQEAPADSDYNWDIDRDNGGQFSQVVSYPGGDVQDIVRGRVNLDNGANAYREVTYVFVCTGTGTQNLRFGIGSPNSPNQFSCGDSTTQVQTNEGTDRINFYVYFVNGSSASFVNYTIIATITG